MSWGDGRLCSGELTWFGSTKSCFCLISIKTADNPQIWSLILLLQTGRLSSRGRQFAQGHIGTSCEAKTRVQTGLTLAQAFTMAPRAQDVFESGPQPGKAYGKELRADVKNDMASC